MIDITTTYRNVAALAVCEPTGTAIILVVALGVALILYQARRQSVDAE